MELIAEGYKLNNSQTNKLFDKLITNKLCELLVSQGPACNFGDRNLNANQVTL